jgi:hypothetical protein
MSLGRVRAIFGDISKVVQLMDRATAMDNGLGSDPTTYAGVPVALPQFKQLITNVATAHAAVKTRVIGATATRQGHIVLLRGAMESERVFVQGLADANQGHAVQIIQNAGLLVAPIPDRTKLLLVLRKGPQPGSVVCDANVKLLIGAGAKHPNANRFFGWEYTLDGSKTFQTSPTTNNGKTLLTGLPLLTVVGVRVNITIQGFTSAWSDVATILVT